MSIEAPEHPKNPYAPDARSPEQRYTDALASGAFMPDEEQGAAIHALDEVWQKLVQRYETSKKPFRRLRHSDTPNGVIYRTPLDEQGEPGRREVFRQFKEGEGIPDGAAMDVEGCYWSALFDGWRIARFSPQGEQLEEYRMPVRCPTMVCFGGDDMKTLFITTTRENMDAEEMAKYPLSGAIFTLPVSVAGMKKSRFIER